MGEVDRLVPDVLRRDEFAALENAEGKATATIKLDELTRLRLADEDPGSGQVGEHTSRHEYN